LYSSGFQVLEMAEVKVVEIKNLTKKFGDVKAVENVSLDVGRGEFLVILGPSGSGKSTLMMMIAGFMKPDEGEILIDGVPVTDKPPYERNVGMVFQSLALFPHMSVHDNIAFPLKMRRIDREDVERRVEEVLDIVRLPGLGERKIHELSGGQQQRVALARTLVFKPAISLLDEPFGALDRKLREEMQLELRKIHDTLNATMLLVTHDQREALVLADDIMVMCDGRIQQKGPTRDVYFRPRNMFVADFMGMTNLLKGVVSEIGSDFILVTTEDGLKLMALKDTDAKMAQTVCLAIKSENVSISKERGSLNVDNVCEGEVKKEVFEGCSVIHEVAVGNRLLRTFSPVSDKVTFKPGEKVFVGWNSDDSVLLTC
jgi:putative spermidine/putrescine transport system ATP-binding protein